MAVSQYALCTLDDVKEFYFSDPNNDAVAVEDNLLEDLIDRVSAQFETECDRQFISREHTEVHDGTGGKYLFPKQYPITSVSGIWQDLNWDFDDNALIASDDYTVKNENTIVLKSTVFYRDDQSIQIIYTAGEATAPNDLRQACAEEVVRLFKNRESIDILGITLDDGTATRYAKDFLPSTLRVLNKYRKRNIF